jgi:hypothetical protein
MFQRDLELRFEPAHQWHLLISSRHDIFQMHLDWPGHDILPVNQQTTYAYCITGVFRFKHNTAFLLSGYIWAISLPVKIIIPPERIHCMGFQASFKHVAFIHGLVHLDLWIHSDPQVTHVYIDV